jgi:hypothetical protein
VLTPALVVRCLHQHSSCGVADLYPGLLHRLEWEQIVTGGGLGASDIKLANSVQDRSPPLEGKRVVVEAALFTAGVVTISAIAALS